MTSQELDQYGGWKKVKHKRTGFFRLEKIDDRWWFIDPEGHPFLSLGINHIKVSVLQEDYNRHVFTEKHENATEFYRHVFHDLKDWGFNTLGNYNDEEIPKKIPFVHLFRFLNISGYLASRQHSGIKDVWESPYKPLIQAMKQVNGDIYHIAAGEKKI
jgi:hypothetical protein